MTLAVEKIADEVRSLPPEQSDQFLSWLAQYQAEQMDDWDRRIERDSQPGGKLQKVLDRVRKNIADGRVKPLDEILDNS